MYFQIFMKTHLEEILKSRFLIYDFFGFLDFRQASGAVV